MTDGFEIQPLRPFTREEVWPLLTGYETHEVYRVEKHESDEITRIEIRLEQRTEPFSDNFEVDFGPEEFVWYHQVLEKGFSFGAYRAGRLIGLLLGEAFADKALLRVWEIQVHAEFRGMGVGRALMERAFAQARQAGLKMVMLETQNTNVQAIRFYRKMGFGLEALDISEYAHLGGRYVEQSAFYMKRRL